VRSTMANGADGACTPLDNFTNDQLKERSRKARHLYSCLENASGETCSPYELHVTPAVLSYLDLVAKEADLEFALRDQPNQLRRLNEEFSAFKNSRPRFSPDAPASFLPVLNATTTFQDEIRRTKDIATEAPKLLEEIRTKLAALSSQEINSYMGILKVSDFDPLRPPLPHLKPEVAKARLDQFYITVTNWHNRQPKTKRGIAFSTDSLMELAIECDRNRFTPDLQYLPESVWGPIDKWNHMRAGEPVLKFKDLIERFQEKEVPAPDVWVKDEASEDVRDLQPFQDFVSSTAKRLTRKQKRGQ
jgi:hypothetical protein